MHVYETPAPITLVLELAVADVEIVAGETARTQVEIRPADPDRRADVAAAQQATVVRTADPRTGDLIAVVVRPSRRLLGQPGGRAAVVVRAEVPAGSSVTGRVEAGDVRASGPLADCRLTDGAGGFDIDRAQSLRLRTGTGDITVGRADGRIDLATASGSIRAEELRGAVDLKNSSGPTAVEQASGAVRARCANGPITLGRVDGSLVAKTANGDVRVRRQAAGSVVAETGRGDVELGLADGVAAWLDLSTGFGVVSNGLTDASRPAPGEPTVEVRARTGMGDIRVHRFVNSTADASDA